MKKKKTWLSIIGIIVVIMLIGGGLFFYQDVYKGNNTMTAQEFSKLTNKKMEIVGTNVFINKDLGKWYFKQRQTKGEFLYHDQGKTYILVSLGKVKDPNTFILLKGVKDKSHKLIISYDTLKMNNTPKNIKFSDDIRSSLIRVSGTYDQVLKAHIVTGN